MQNPKSLALRRIDALVEAITERYTQALPTGHAPISDVDAFRLGLTSLQAAKTICSESSPHYAELAELFRDYKHTGIFATDKWLGVLQAVADDLRSGMLSGVREMVTAEVFTDLSEMAEYLIEQGYQIPAVSVSGAVLEDSLRKVCEKSGTKWVGDSSISKLNAELYKNGVYDKVQHGQIEAWGKLRNKVDHGDFGSADEIDARDARRMTDGVRDFVSRFVV